MSIQRLRVTFFSMLGLALTLVATLFFSVASWLDVQRRIARESLPVELWYRAGTPIVEDAAAGTCPGMTFDREIGQPFRADWTVTILVQQPDGDFETKRTFFGGNDYSPENDLPDDLHLCWWAWVDDPADLALEPGRTYRVNTLWELDLGEFGERKVRRSSPPFTIN